MYWFSNLIVKGSHPFHWSDCSVYNEPAFPAGPCDCGAVIAHKKWYSYARHLFYIRVSACRMSLQATLKKLFCRGT